MKSHKLGFLLTLAVSACAFSSQKSAAVTTSYTNLGSWQSAAPSTPGYGSTTTETFTSTSPTYFASSSTTAANVAFGPVAFNGFNVSGTSNGDTVGVANVNISSGVDSPNPMSGQNYLGWGQGNLNNGGIAPTVTITFTDPTFGFGFDWFNTDFSDNYLLTLSTGNTYSSPSLFGFQSSGFFGITSDTPITSFTLQTLSSGGFVSTAGIDNVRTVQAIPEPASAILIGIGGLFLLRHRRHDA